ncbi:MAG: outer membrane lipoprotein carrier protein LolA [Desulfurivibrionaceae bacterium]|jgi:outer membrane lipoprotein-sorting protein
MKLFFLLLSFSFFLPVQVTAGEIPDQATIRLRSVQADFLQEKHLKILARPIISTGTFTFQSPQSLRWEYRKPIPSILLMHAGKVKKFVERDGQLAEDTRMQLDSMQVVLSEISNWVDGRFTDNKMFKVSFPKKQTVLLTPKEQGLAALISSIELKLANQNGLLDEVTIFEGPDSFTRLTFTNRVLNREIPAALFTER